MERDQPVGISVDLRELGVFPPGAVVHRVELRHHVGFVLEFLRDSLCFLDCDMGIRLELGF